MSKHYYYDIMTAIFECHSYTGAQRLIDTAETINYIGIHLEVQYNCTKHKLVQSGKESETGRFLFERIRNQTLTARLNWFIYHFWKVPHLKVSFYIIRNRWVVLIKQRSCIYKPLCPPKPEFGAAVVDTRMVQAGQDIYNPRLKICCKLNNE